MLLLLVSNEITLEQEEEAVPFEPWWRDNHLMTVDRSQTYEEPFSTVTSLFRCEVGQGYSDNEVSVSWTAKVVTIIHISRNFTQCWRVQRLFITVHFFWGGYFWRSSITRESFRKVFLIELLDVAFKLEGLHVPQIMPEVLAKVAEVVEEAKKVCVRVDWFEKVIGRILKAKDH